ncbi:MAG: hypothetical protein ACYC9W_07460, partial [Candidatus Limnocylindria bacterium]
YVGDRAWRVLHYGTYVILPLALLHGLGTGTDTRSVWGLAIYGACIAALVTASAVRVSHNPERWRYLRPPFAAAAAICIAALGAWLVVGPTRPGWAVAAGTPPALTRSLASPTPSPTPVPPVALARPFEDRVTGTLGELTDTSLTATGAATGAVDLRWAVHAQVDATGIAGTLEVDRSDGSPICTANIIGTNSQGIVATCDPPQTHGSVTFVLALQRVSDGDQLTGVIAVQDGTAGRP